MDPSKFAPHNLHPRWQPSLYASAVPAGLAGIWQSGFLAFLPKGPLSLCVAIAVVAGVLGGLVRGTTWKLRLLFIIPYIVGTCTFTLGTALYVRGRHTIIAIELLVPALAAFLAAFPFYRRVARAEGLTPSR